MIETPIYCRRNAQHLAVRARHSPRTTPLPASLGWVMLATLLYPSLAAAAPVDSSSPLVLAYIDPGTGSFLVQAIVAAVAGVAVTSRMYWEKIRVFFGATPRETKEADDDTLDG